MYSTARDYAKFLISVMKDEGLTEAISQDRRRIHASQRDMCKGAPIGVCPEELGMGLGWQIFRFKYETFLMHTGRDPGLFTITYFSKTTRSGAVILTNGQNGHRIVLPILERLQTSPAFVEFLRSQAK